jgi:hypothetical protein
MKKPPRVPRWRLAQGVLHCCAITGLRLGEAERLLDAGFPTQATIIFSFAVEEFGKAVLLRRAFEASDERDSLVVVEGFYDHQAKLDAAATVIPEEFLRIGNASSADDWTVRLDAMFLNWIPESPDGPEGDWRHGVRGQTDPEVLSKSIEGVNAELANMSAWVGTVGI